MPDLATATGNYINAIKNLNEKANRYAKAKKVWEDATVRAMELSARFQQDSTNENLMKRSREASSYARGVCAEDNKAQNAYEDAWKAFIAAYAAFMNALNSQIFGK